MGKINRQDTNGVKPLLATGEFGYDNYPAGGDEGRVYVGTGTKNVALANKSEVAVVVETINDFPANAETGDTVIVKDLNRGGTFIYDATKSAVNNGGTIFDGWVRQEIDKAIIEYDLFVIYGQSNALGFAGTTEGRGDIPDDCYYWTNRVGTPTWNVLVHDMMYVQPGASNSTGNAWIEFAREYKKRTGRGVLYLPAAFGGKSLAELSYRTTYYDRLLPLRTAHRG